MQAPRALQGLQLGRDLCLGAGAHLSRANLELPGSGGRDPEARRLQEHLCRRHAGGDDAGRGWHAGRLGQPLRPPWRDCLPAAARQRAVAQLRLPPVELRHERQPPGRAVPPGAGQRHRDAEGFRPEAAQPPPAQGRKLPRAGVRHLQRLGARPSDLYRARDAALRRSHLLQAGGLPGLHAAILRQQLEAVPGEREGPLPRQPAAPVPHHVQHLPRRHARQMRPRRGARAAQHHLRVEGPGPGQRR